MDRQEIVLAALAPANGKPHRPVVVQKLLFMIDREIPKLVDGPHFNFQPYAYGPFDVAVYTTLEGLAMMDLVEIIPERTWQNYRLTEAGQKKGDELFKDLDNKARTFIKDASKLLMRLSFSDLVRAIYKAYPEMKENSVFQG